jgi:hypothetical protein
MHLGLQNRYSHVVSCFQYAWTHSQCIPYVTLIYISLYPVIHALPHSARLPTTHLVFPFKLPSAVHISPGARSTKFCTVAPDACRSSVGNCTISPFWRLGF